nr:MAG TPA: hypothetical protein [Caudoviricetes sp.]
MLFANSHRSVCLSAFLSSLLTRNLSCIFK